MSIVQLEAVPEGTLLQRYVDRGHTDCYTTEVAAAVTQAAFVEAFYTTRIFKLERLLLAMLASKPSTDVQAVQLAAGTLNDFAAWHVEARAPGELLMCDFRGTTRSWLMTVPVGSGETAGTRLYFGSAVVAVVDAATGKAAPAIGFRMLMGFHKLYSRVLLHAACSRVRRMQRASVFRN